MRIYDYMKGILGAMGVGEDVGVPEPSWRIEEYLKAIYDKLKEGGSLPAVTSSDNGKVLAVKDGAWAASEQGKKFLVTLTPTAQDFSGTMDKTPAEITTAYEAGQDIEFDIPSLSVKCKAMEFALSNNLIMAGAIVTYRTGASHLLIEILTDATDSTYATHIYALTPAS